MMRGGWHFLSWRGPWLLLAFSTDAFTAPRSLVGRARLVCKDNAMGSFVGLAPPRTESRAAVVSS
jgi:hypothetical protein